MTASAYEIEAAVKAMGRVVLVNGIFGHELLYEQELEELARVALEAAAKARSQASGKAA
jgi:hypothetical protein